MVEGITPGNLGQREGAFVRINGQSVSGQIFWETDWRLAEIEYFELSGKNPLLYGFLRTLFSVTISSS